MMDPHFAYYARRNRLANAHCDIQGKHGIKWIASTGVQDDCEVCGKQKRRLYADHCHGCGRLRGYLCPSCNSMEAHSADPKWDAWRRRCEGSDTIYPEGRSWSYGDCMPERCPSNDAFITAVRAAWAADAL